MFRLKPTFNYLTTTVNWQVKITNLSMLGNVTNVPKA